MKIYDISVALSDELPVFPGDPPVRIEPATMLARGDAANVSRISFSTHSGTHLDPPRHFNDQGATIDTLPLSLFIGRALVAEITGIQAIDREELARLPLEGVERLLLKTDNSLLWDRSGFSGDFAHLTPDGAHYLVEMGVKLIGIDYLSIESIHGEGEVHRCLLDNEVVILEGLKLSGIVAGSYELICFPLKITDGDGGPVRAVLRTLARADSELHATG